MNEDIVYPSLYEKDYILRSLGSIVNDPEVALTELVANAWDAGASHVRIFIPDAINQILYIEDDGVGMTEYEFQNRWMKLRYNRLTEQGKFVTFPINKNHKPRVAFGRNGVGRHGLFCFGDEYKVITCKENKKHTFVVQPNVKTHPFAVVDKIEESCVGHGTRLEVLVDRHLPNTDKIREIISARFLQDPEFIIEVNNKILQLDDLCGGSHPTELLVPETDIHLTAYFIDTTKSSRKSIFHGIAIWQNGRLVGEPSWTLGERVILDGRTALAKRYTIIITSNDLSEYINEDWTSFKDVDEVHKMYDLVDDYVSEQINKYTDHIAETITDNLEPTVKRKLSTINPLAQLEIKDTIRQIVNENPKIKQDSVNVAIQALINIQRSQNGAELLEKLVQLDESDLIGLNEMLNKWTVKDALSVLNEVDRRLSIIEAIHKLAGDDNTDELHVLHPLIAESRWLFGPEYESSEYIFNKQIKTAAIQIFGADVFANPDIHYNKRADLICLPTSTIGITGIEDVDDVDGLTQVRKLLLIELKKGKFKISRKERDQAHGYIEDLLKSTLGNNVKIVGYVVGDTYDQSLSHKIEVDDGRGVLYVTTYSQLVDTAERRMFNLRKILAKRYENVPGMQLYAQVQQTIKH